MQEVAQLAWDAGTATVQIVAVPEGVPVGWDLGDPLPEGWTEETVRAALVEAAPFEPNGEIQGEFGLLRRRRGMEEPGISRLLEGKYKDTGEINTTWEWFRSRLEIQADSRNASGESWGSLLEIHDRDGRVHDWTMPMSLTIHRLASSYCRRTASCLSGTAAAVRVNWDERLQVVGTLG